MKTIRLNWSAAAAVAAAATLAAEPLNAPAQESVAAGAPPAGPVVGQLEWVLRHGTAEQRDALVARALAAHERETGTELEVLRAFC